MKKNSNGKKKIGYQVRLTDEELADYNLMAEDVGLPSVASFIRYVVIRYKKDIVKQNASLS